MNAETEEKKDEKGKQGESSEAEQKKLKEEEAQKEKKVLAQKDREKQNSMGGLQLLNNIVDNQARLFGPEREEAKSAIQVIAKYIQAY